MVRARLAVVAFVACATPPPGTSPIAHVPAPAPIDCTYAGAAIAAVAGFGGPFAAHCRDDRWSDFAVRCFARAAAAGDLVSCAAKLDDAARNALFGVLEDRRNERVFAAIHA